MWCGLHHHNDLQEIIMYSMKVVFKFGRLQVEKTINGTDRDACMADINYTLDANPAIELVIIEEIVWPTRP